MKHLSSRQWRDCPSRADIWSILSWNRLWTQQLQLISHRRRMALFLCFARWNTHCSLSQCPLWQVSSCFGGHRWSDRNPCCWLSHRYLKFTKKKTSFFFSLNAQKSNYGIHGYLSLLSLCAFLVGAAVSYYPSGQHERQNRGKTNTPLGFASIL